MTKLLNYLLLLLGVIFLALPAGVSAQVLITEIMYDLSGSDTDREWIEIQNTSAAAIDLSNWKLFEANTNHSLTSVQGGGTLAAGAFAVIADKAEEFLADWPSFSGILFDSSFSLSNSGETISIRDGSLADIDTVSYTSSQGAAGDGNSLQRSGSGWIAGLPTPGAASGAPPAGGPPAQSTQTSTAAPSASGAAVAGPATSETKELTLNIGRNRSGAVGVPLLFEAVLSGRAAGKNTSATFVWNFGDGRRLEGQKVYHTWQFPGEYVVVASASDGNASASSRITVKISPFSLSISDAKSGKSGFVEITNNSSEEVNLFGLKLMAGGYLFPFPADTIILPGRAASFPNQVTGLIFSDRDTIWLLYPDGKTASTLVLKNPVSLNQNPPVNLEQARIIADQLIKAQGQLVILQRQLASLNSPRPSPASDRDKGGPQPKPEVELKEPPQENNLAAVVTAAPTPLPGPAVSEPRGFWQTLLSFIRKLF